MQSRALLVYLTFACVSRASAAELRVLPPTTVLTGPVAQQRLLAVTLESGRVVADRTTESRFTSSDPNVATVDADGVVRATGDGAATITVTSNGETATASVSVARFKEPAAWSFRKHVLPVLTKAGCNSGACHGALAGKGGFKLSLRGYDPETDHFVLTRQAGGRRIDRTKPDQSLRAAQADAGRCRTAAASGSKPIAGVPPLARMDRLRSARRPPRRTRARAARSVPGSRVAEAEGQAADRRPRSVHRRPHRGRDALGEVHLERGPGRHRR